jgi:flagellar M-ring protein FliF
MPGSIAQYLKQFQEIWSRLNKTQRFTVLFFSVVVFCGLGVMTYFMNRVDYQVLYRDLNPEDAQAIATKLKEDKRDYQVQGNSILVAGPTSDVDKMRLEIAASGLARSGKIGYEIFDKNQFGMTDFTEQVNLQRALEGELARTISSLNEISQARVHLVMPKDSVFEEKKEEAKASVVLRLKKGIELPKASIAGIKGVVAGAVPGLHPYNVSVVDDEGRLLAQSAGTTDDGRSELETGIRAQLEKEMTTKVVSILEPVLGKGRVHANASIDLDFNTTEQTEETFNPNPQAITSQQKTEERIGSSGMAGGVPGSAPASANSSAQNQTSAADRSRQSEITNYEVSKMVRHTVQPKGTVRRLSVAVILDNKTVFKQGPDGKFSGTTQPISAEELDKWRALVQSAIGYNKDRGDTVTVENVPFYTDLQPKEEGPQVPWYGLLLKGAPKVDPNAPWYVRYQPLLLPAIKYSSFLLLFLMVYLILFRPLKKRVFQTLAVIAPPPAIAGELPAAEGDLGARALAAGVSTEEAAAMESAAAAISGERPPTQDLESSLATLDEQIEREFLNEASMVDMDERKYAVLRRKLSEKAIKDPELISQLIRTWIQER